MSTAVAVVLREKPDPDLDLLARVPPIDVYASGRFSGYIDIRVFVRASTWAQADAIAAQLFEQGRERFCTTPPPGGWWSSAGISVYPHAPDAALRFG